MVCRQLLTPSPLLPSSSANGLQQPGVRRHLGRHRRRTWRKVSSSLATASFLSFLVYIANIVTCLAIV